MFGTARQFMDLDWSPYLETTGANFNEGGEFQMANPDPWGLGPSGDVADRSFKMHNMASVWNGANYCVPLWFAIPCTHSLPLSRSCFSFPPHSLSLPSLPSCVTLVRTHAVRVCTPSRERSQSLPGSV